MSNNEFGMNNELGIAYESWGTHKTIWGESILIIKSRTVGQKLGAGGPISFLKYKDTLFSPKGLGVASLL